MQWSNFEDGGRPVPSVRGKPPAYQIQLGARVFQADAGLEACDHFNQSHALVALLRGIDGKRHPDFIPGGETEAVGRDTDDRVARVIKRDGLADQTWVAAVTAKPKTFADHYHLIAPRRVFSG